MFKEDSVFQLKQVGNCITDENFKIENNIYCSPDNKPGLLLGLVKVTFCATLSNSGDIKNEVLIDVGLSKYLSVPIKLKVATTKLSEYLKSEKLPLDIESVMGNSKLRIKEMHPNSVSLEDKQLVRRYNDQLKLKCRELFSNNCATLLESTDQTLYYEKLCMFLYLEGDYRRRLIQRYGIHTGIPVHVPYPQMFLYLEYLNTVRR